jgi:hypothetical protein
MPPKPTLIAYPGPESPRIARSSRVSQAGRTHQALLREDIPIYDSISFGIENFQFWMPGALKDPTLKDPN